MASLAAPHWEAIVPDTRQLLQELGGLVELFARSAEKYPRSRGSGMRVLSALVDLEIADGQDDPVLLMPVAWARVKAFFATEARRLGQKWFGQAENGKR